MCDRPPCDCEEEKLRRAEQQARIRFRKSHGLPLEGEDAILEELMQERRLKGLPADGAYEVIRRRANEEEPPPRFSILQIIIGSTSFLMGLAAFLIKFEIVENNTAHAILSKVGLGRLVPHIKKLSPQCEALRLKRLDEARRKREAKERYCAS